MLHLQPKKLPGIIESTLLLLVTIGIISYFIIEIQTVPHIPILIGILIMIAYGYMKKMTFKNLQFGMTQGAQTGMGAVLLFFVIGVLIASWMASGTIPALMNAGFLLAGGPWLLAIIFAVTAIVGVALGSSFTTAATVGVAFIGVAQSMDVSLAMAAGAIVSGAFFGDKMSPLSDTTNLASTVVKVDLFDHIKNMSWTTIPAFIITFILFMILSPNGTANVEQLENFQSGLNASGLIHWTSWIPLAVLIAMTVTKRPAFLSLAISSITATLIAGFRGVLGWGTLFGTWFDGFQGNTESEVVNELLTRGGMNGMLFTVSLVILALALGGLFFVTGVIPAILTRVQDSLKSARAAILSTAFTAIGINITIGEQYLSILLTGEAYQDIYEKAGLAKKNLSRTLEDAGTVINPLVPWSVCGVFLSGVLGVPVLEYLPFAFFCLISPLLTILFGITGKTLTPKEVNLRSIEKADENNFTHSKSL
ncbi:Na+/H+ antiporter NhaC [Halobacillus karajensis]|uniref:Sodium/proton antiporter n=1 Tax=Halobacillus karajensis TaxID=195088 RepID=A0A059NW92_9BACI|nr:Na+/H+ antiporter NhaC [Halobacillus karajensis]CDQ21142.1 Sodium/proton antiporter [Halobacillus karajensis]CDQ24794.1 Sodium/proton antiporter [Halobacillus karajensis]CDQ28846.1 Sodium/proton antiporter [Halobacillus karajensis]